MSSTIQCCSVSDKIRFGSSRLLRTDCLFVCCAQTVLLLVSIWSSAGPSEKGLVTNSRKSIGRLKRSPHPPSPPMVFKFGYVTYSMSIFIPFYSRFLLYIQCYMLWHLSFPDFWSKILYGLHRLFNEEIPIFCESQFIHIHLKDYLPKKLWVQILIWVFRMSSSSPAAFVRKVVRTPSSHLGVPLSLNCPNIWIIYLERTLKHIGGVKLRLLCASKATRLPWSLTNNLSITSISRRLVSTSKLQYAPEYWQSISYTFKDTNHTIAFSALGRARAWFSRVWLF